MLHLTRGGLSIELLSWLPSILFIYFIFFFQKVLMYFFNNFFFCCLFIYYFILIYFSLILSTKRKFLNFSNITKDIFEYFHKIINLILIYFAYKFKFFVIFLTHRFDDQTVNAHALCVGSLKFKSRTGQILHSIANGSPPLQYLCK